MGLSMSERGRQFFDAYVAQSLNDPHLDAFSMQSHAYSLVTEARSAGIRTEEIVEEVGEIPQALALALMEGKR
jgi:hypothetical protein